MRVAEDFQLHAEMQTQFRGGVPLTSCNLRGEGVSGGSVSSRGRTWYCSFAEPTSSPPKSLVLDVLRGQLERI